MYALWRIALTNPHKEPFVVQRNISSVRRIAALSAIITIPYLSSTCAQTGSSPELSPLTASGIESPAFHSDEKPVVSTDLFLEVHVSTSEQSKDSHGRSRSVVVKDGLITYSVRYSGMDPRPARKESFSLTQENLDYYQDINGLLMFMHSALGFAAIEP